MGKKDRKEKDIKTEVPMPETFDDLSRLLASFRAGRVNEAAEILRKLERLRKKTDPFMAEHYAGRKWDSWLTLHTWFEFMELEGVIEFETAEAMREHLARLQPPCDSP